MKFKRKKINNDVLKKVFLLLLVIYSSYKLYNRIDIKKNAVITYGIVKEKICKASTFGHSSSLKIEYNGRKYNVYLNSSKCEKIILGSKIKLLYSKEKDVFFDLDKKIFYFF